MTSTISAWTYGNIGFPDALKLSKIALDDRPLRSTEILVRVKAAALNPVDIQLMNFPLLNILPKFLVPRKGAGEDFSGVVEQAGAASGFKSSDEVLGSIFVFPNGTLQEMIRIDTAETQNAAVHKPKNWTWVQAAALPLVWLTACTLMDKTKSYVSKGGTVAILGGSSASGMCAIYLAKQRGWHVIASCSAPKAELVQLMGADRTIDYRTANVADELGKLQLDAIIDCVGGKECIGLAPRYVTIVGDKTCWLSIGGSIDYLFEPKLIWRSLMGLFGFGPSYLCINMETRKSWLEDLVRLPTSRIIIDSVFPFTEVKEAYERLNTGHATGKVVMRMDE